ncbi:MAG: alcohol dehydrogenase catalytic domain-containing protein, partial [Sphingomonadales bacterium]|nr:alcohol dehydrogenase catalytic domain-containing protein [Sphingomonadales bacterium]
MKALLCKEFGTADRLVLEEIADPIAGKGEVVVDVKAAGINFPDTLIIEGKYQFKPPFPFTPGGESSGVVSAVGDGVDGFAIGDRVIASMMVGGFAEKALAPAEMLTKIPDEMNFNTAAGFTVTYATSYHALKQRANLQAGETLLVLGAAGGVGLAAVELGKAMGAKVIAAASTDDKLEVCKTAGADEVINYS